MAKDIKEMFWLTAIFSLVTIIPIGLWQIIDFLGFWPKMAAWALYYIVFTAAIAENFLRKRGLKWADIGITREMDVRRGVLFAPLFAVASIAVGWTAAEMLGLRQPANSGLVKFVMQYFSDDLSGRLFLAWFMFPIALCEELVFRGIMLNFLEKRRGFPIALLVSSLFFALLHGNPSAMAVTFVYGLIWGGAYKLGRGLFASAGAHYLHNVAAFYF